LLTSNSLLSKLKPKLIFLALAFLVVFGLNYFFYQVTVCPSKLIYGKPCPSCGTTRSFFSLLKGNIASAVYFNFLWISVLFLGLLSLAFGEWKKLPSTLFNSRYPIGYLFWFVIALQWILNLAQNK